MKGSREEEMAKWRSVAAEGEEEENRVKEEERREEETW